MIIVCSKHNTLASNEICLTCQQWLCASCKGNHKNCRKLTTQFNPMIKEWTYTNAFKQNLRENNKNSLAKILAQENNKYNQPTTFWSMLSKNIIAHARKSMKQFVGNKCSAPRILCYIKNRKMILYNVASKKIASTSPSCIHLDDNTTSILVNSTLIYILKGNHLISYNSKSNQFNPLKNALFNIVSRGVGDELGFLYSVGGQDASQPPGECNELNPCAEFEKYDIKNDNWCYLAKMNIERDKPAVYVKPKEFLLAFGQWCSWDHIGKSSAFERYDFKVDKWHNVAIINQNDYYTQCSWGFSESADGTILLFGYFWVNRMENKHINGVFKVVFTTENMTTFTIIKEIACKEAKIISNALLYSGSIWAINSFYIPEEFKAK